MPHLSTVLALGAALPKSFTAALLGICRTLKTHRSRSWTSGACDRIDDRLLRDIGMSRSSLMAAGRLKKPRYGEARDRDR